MSQALYNGMRSFCQHTSIHGFSHASARGRHWIERLLWTVVLSVAVWGILDTSLGQWQRYRENPTVVTLEKAVRTWRNNLPGVTACSKNRVKKDSLHAVVKYFWNVEESDEKFQYYSSFVKNVSNSNLFHLEGYVEFKDDPSLNINLYELVQQVMVDHHVKMTSSETVTPHWTPVMTEAGICFTTNSIALDDIAITKPYQNNTSLPYSCQNNGKPCYLMFESNNEVDYYLHSPYDIPDVTVNPSRVYPSLKRFTVLSSMETRAGAGVRDLSSTRRRCKYTDEPEYPGLKVYSTNTCRMHFRSTMTMEVCGCKPFYYFYEDGPTCTTAGMACVATITHKLATFAGKQYPCSQQCFDAVYREVSTTDHVFHRLARCFILLVFGRDQGLFQGSGAVRFILQAPRIRYTRNIVFHFHDLVVSFGGAIGLFMGASFISFVEIIYYILNHVFKIDAPDKKHFKTENRPYDHRIQILTKILEEHADS